MLGVLAGLPFPGPLRNSLPWVTSNPTLGRQIRVPDPDFMARPLLSFQELKQFWPLSLHLPFSLLSFPFFLHPSFFLSFIFSFCLERMPPCLHFLWLCAGFCALDETAISLPFLIYIYLSGCTGFIVLFKSFIPLLMFCLLLNPLLNVGHWNLLISLVKCLFLPLILSVFASSTQGFYILHKCKNSA